jgi:glycine dehydrogenase
LSVNVFGPRRFSDRHIGPSDADVRAMLEVVGWDSTDSLVDDAIPAAIRTRCALNLPAARTEEQVLTGLRAVAAKNQPKIQMIGLGYYDTITPPVLRRNMLENPAWYTSYTPYQPEISQGRLEALLTFQTLVEDLTALPLAGASLLDEATAVTEAVLLMRRAARGNKSARVVVDSNCFPQTRAVLANRAAAVDIDVVEANLAVGLPDGDFFGVVFQNPAADGLVRDLTSVIAEAKDRNALTTVATDLLAVTLFAPPGEQGADIAVGSAQRLGVPLFFGGPHAGFMAVRDGLERLLPGRLVGVSRDRDGARAYRLALQTREQHIRRDKATSNICTAQALLANVAAMYGAYHGPDGLTAIARRIHAHAVGVAAGLRGAGIAVAHDDFFDTVIAEVPGSAHAIVAAAAEDGINLRLVDDDHVGVSCGESISAETVARVLSAFGAGPLAAAVDAGIAEPVRRVSTFLSHPTFHAYRSETAMMRYLRALADKDLALDRTMIPLGSCTMKLNSAAEMEPISWPEFADLHPFAPAEQTEGYRELIADLEGWLAEITGYDAVSLQPNAGSQGELAGLLAIRTYHESRGDAARRVCLIPQSAHGTNAASAVLAGMQVVVVATRDGGDIDLDDLTTKIGDHRGHVAAIMITYPSTHGVYEHDVTTVCDLVHAEGGQVYIDGANLNALVGLARPGDFGGDVSHLNLHKTFCIPHGGGGPGVGPVAVRAHLTPHLPGDPLGSTDADTAVSAANYGSAGILPITWSYLALMGPDGLRAATQTAVLSANYVARRLAPYFPVLYTGDTGLVAHECILDLRSVTKTTGVTAEDVAKRLIDYGFHAPTLSFPVNGTLMVEPTESEDRAELDRFIDAMIAIHGEITQIAAGIWTLEDSPLRQAPHTAEMTTAEEWTLPYSRRLATFPAGESGAAKYWPPVRRIDGVFGDRNLVCACPEPDAFENLSATREEVHT